MIQLSHIGELLISEMFNRSENVRHLLVNNVLSPSLSTSALQAIPEIQLTSCGGYRFDGAHKIDVAVMASKTKECLAIEAKLGHDRLGRREFEKRFLKGCGTSHGDSRISGSMVSILEGKLPVGCEKEAVIVEYREDTYRLLPRWVLVVRQRIIDAWLKNGRPSLTHRCIAYAFESIVSCYGGSEPFNELVSELISGDYYQEWIGDGQQPHSRRS